jgi:nickel-dependent lactate racemase
MTKSYNLLYGKEKLTFQFPDEIEMQLIEVNKMPAIEDYEEEIRSILDDPINSPPLKEIISKGETVVIIVSDITRLAYKTDRYLPILLDELNQIGIPDEDITIVISTGTHRSHTPEEDELVIGSEVYNRIKVENHEAKADDLVNLGESSRGTEITINRTVYEADRIILTGGITYHFLAGFGGGRKSIMPGVCGYDSVQQNHSLALKDVDSSGVNPKIDSGVLKGNPVSEDMFEIAEKVNPDFMINVVVNDNKDYVTIVAGDLNEAFERGCKMVDKAFGVQTEKKSDLVVCSCGGYPKDIVLYQSVKGLNNAGYAVKDDGVIILCSECVDGGGPDNFMKWFDYSGVDDLKDALKKDFTIAGFIALRAATIASRANVILISDLSDELIEKTGMIPAQTPEEAYQKAEEILDNVDTVTLMPQGALTFPMIEG